MADPDLDADFLARASAVFERQEFAHYAKHRDVILARLTADPWARTKFAIITGDLAVGEAEALVRRRKSVIRRGSRLPPSISLGMAGLSLAILGILVWFRASGERSLLFISLVPFVLCLGLGVGAVVLGWRTRARKLRLAEVSLLDARRAKEQALTAAVLEAVSTAINEELGPKGIVAFPTHAPRLVELDVTEIRPSSTTRYVKEFVLEHESSAVGLAGSRGSGKSTVIRALQADKDIGGPVVVVPSPVRYESGEFLRRLLSEIATAVIGGARTRALPSPEVRLARELLRDLRWEFERSTSGKGTVKVLSFFEGGAERGYKYRNRAMTRADLVGAIRELLRTFAAQPGRERMVVCVDELDKVSTPEDLVEIVNELKDLFHIQKVHFVVAVSTDALDSFARRGLAGRDAFDSAFDTVVHTRWLTLDESVDVLKARATGFPPILATLCHAWSGGLARDLLRAARAAVEYQRRDPERPLSVEQIVTELVLADLGDAIRASMRGLRHDDPQLDGLWTLHHESTSDLDLVTRVRKVEAVEFSDPVLLALRAKVRLGLSLLRLARLATGLPNYWVEDGDMARTLRSRAVDHAEAVRVLGEPGPVREAAVRAATREFEPSG